MSRKIKNIKKIEFYDYVYKFSIDYDAMDIPDILDIHIHLMTSILWNNAWIY